MNRRLIATQILIVVTIVFFWFSVSAAETLTLGAGAGYKRMLQSVLAVYEQTTGQKVDQVYGHMGQVTSQAKAGRTIGVIFGELSFLKSSGLEFADFKELGQGVLALAYGKGVRLSAPADLTKPEIKKVAIPNAKQATYGKAAFEVLKKSGLGGKIQDKIIQVGGVPQVSSYLISKDVEAGFINITDAIYIKDKIGGWLVIDKSEYSPIRLVLGVLKGFENDPEVKQFTDFMTMNQKAREIMKKSGLGD